jgi:hypothetical protein
MISSSEGEKKKKKTQSYSSVARVSSTTIATPLEDLLRHHAQQQQLQQQQYQEFSMPSTFSYQMTHCPLAPQQWQQDVGAQPWSNVVASFPSAAAASAINPILFTLQDPRSMIRGRNIATTAGLFRCPPQPRSACLYTPNEIAGDGTIGSSSYVDETTSWNLPAQVALFRQQQQSIAHAPPAELFTGNPVDGGSLYLQERLQGSSRGQPQSTQKSGFQLPSSSLSAFSNPSDVECSFMACGNTSGSSSAKDTTGPGFPATTLDGAELSRRIMMLRQELGAAPVSTSTSTLARSGSLSIDTTSAGLSRPRCDSDLSNVKHKVVEGGYDRFSSTSRSTKEGRKATPQKRSPRQMTKVPRSIYATASSTSTRTTFPFVLYSEDDDEYLTPYQCLLRKQLELFVADPEDVRCSSQQGRTTSIQVGQVGLRCRHCEGGLASRTKGAVYYSHSIDGIYQIGQNIGKVHLAERCYRIPDDVRRHLIEMRKDSRRASSGKAYWADRIRAIGVYEEGNILKQRGSIAVEDNGVVHSPESQVEDETTVSRKTTRNEKSKSRRKRSKTANPQND